MIGIANLQLPVTVQSVLDIHQANINSLPSFPDRVTTAKQQFEAENRIGNTTFDEIKVALTKMCAGARRCMYCEDSAADKVEHIKPKNLYPEEVFVWLNYLYACGPCNSPKQNKFAVYSATSGRHINVTRRKKAAVIPPMPGTPVLINPRKEDPLDFMTLDLNGTFLFVGLGTKRSRQYRRATYTIELLGLNRRDYLVMARRDAAHYYSVHLCHYVLRRNAGATQPELNELIKVIKNMPHPTVWREM